MASMRPLSRRRRSSRLSLVPSARAASMSRPFAAMTFLLMGAQGGRHGGQRRIALLPGRLGERHARGLRGLRGAAHLFPQRFLGHASSFFHRSPACAGPSAPCRRRQEPCGAAGGAHRLLIRTRSARRDGRAGAWPGARAGGCAPWPRACGRRQAPPRRLRTPPCRARTGGLPRP